MSRMRPELPFILILVSLPDMATVIRSVGSHSVNIPIRDLLGQEVSAQEVLVRELRSILEMDLSGRSTSSVLSDETRHLMCFMKYEVHLIVRA